MARLANVAKRRPLTKQEQEKLQRELAMMRMICDTNFILDPEERTCPKLAELAEPALAFAQLARVLGPAGFEQETRSNLLEAALALGRALAVENRLPEPAATAEVVVPPLSHPWKAALAELTAFVSNDTADWKPIASRLRAVLEF